MTLNAAFLIFNLICLIAVKEPFLFTSEDCKELCDVDEDLAAVTDCEDEDDEDEDTGDEQLSPLPEEEWESNDGDI